VVCIVRLLAQMAIMAVMFLGGAAGAALGADPAELTLGVSSSGLTVFAVWMAEAGGFYKKEGLEKFRRCTRGSDRSRRRIAKARTCA